MIQTHSEPLAGATATVLVPVTEDGDVEPRFGRAPRVAVANIVGGKIASWREYAVGWDITHDAVTAGSHHARIVRFLNEQNVDTVVVEHMGAGMRRVVARMKIRLLATAGGEARAAVMTALHTARSSTP